jgi:hypothetical protein
MTKTTLVTILLQKVEPEATPRCDPEVFTPDNVNVLQKHKWIAPIPLSVAGQTILHANVGRGTAVGYHRGTGSSPFSEEHVQLS